MPSLLVACIAGISLTLSVAAFSAPPDRQGGVGAVPASAVDVDSVRQLFEKGEYPQALRQATAALAAKGKGAAGPAARHELLVLKGETHLRMKNNVAAAEAFTGAAAVASDEQAAALARSMAELARRAKGLTYTPAARKGAAAPQPLDISIRSERPAAFVAMFDESAPRVEAAVKAARASGEMPAMLDAFAMLHDLRALEIAGRGSRAKTDKMSAELIVRATSLMKRAVAEMTETVAAIEAAAYSVHADVRVVGRSTQVVGLGQAGLQIGDAQTLRRVAADCQRISDIAVRLKQSFAVDEEAEALSALRSDANVLAARARWTSKLRVEPPPPSPRPGVDMGQNRPGTARVQRPAPKGNPSAGPRGVGTAAR